MLIPTHALLSSQFPADATVPEAYLKAFAAIDTSNTGEVSVNALSRVLASSTLPATTIDRVPVFFASRSPNALINTAPDCKLG